MTFKVDRSADHVDPQFKAGFAAGVKWGILSFMQHPNEDNINFHIAEAQRWYWLVVVDNGKTLIDMANKTNRDERVTAQEEKREWREAR